jgi:putative hydrolase of the HAD superfamily
MARVPSVVLFDLDGIIRTWERGRDARIEAAFTLPPGSIRRVAFEPVLLQLAITGAISDGEWRNRIAETLQAEYPTSRAHDAVATWSASPGSLDLQTYAIVERCGKSRPIGVLTNATTRLTEDLVALGVAGAFAYIFNSAEIGYAKPDPRAFEAVRAAIGIPAQDILFIDDKKENVAAAQNQGFAALPFTSRDQLRADLHLAGVEI